jgi:hypothetical protein
MSLLTISKARYSLIAIVTNQGIPSKLMSNAVTRQINHHLIDNFDNLEIARQAWLADGSPSLAASEPWRQVLANANIALGQLVLCDQELDGIEIEVVCDENEECERPRAD